MTGPSTGREGHEVDALVTDRYLEALLVAHARGADHGPAGTPPPEPFRRTADRLARDLPRLHPSFRFEEALAGRLAEVAAGLRLPAAAGAEGLVVPIGSRTGRGTSPDGDQTALDELAADPGSDHRSRVGRPLLIGGALTSAALSLAGAAYVAWRLNRPPGSPMARAARAVTRTRPA